MAGHKNKMGFMTHLFFDPFIFSFRVVQYVICLFRGFRFTLLLFKLDRSSLFVGFVSLCAWVFSSGCMERG